MSIQGSQKLDKYPRKFIPLHPGESTNDKGTAYAELITSAELAAHRIIVLMQPKHLAKEIDVPTLMTALTSQIKAVNSGDTTRSEGMLMSQATALQSVFVRLCELALEQHHMPNLEGFMRLALKAQAQSRATLEALSAIKNPPIVYANQANLTTGPQQVNNHFAQREFEIEQNQLSGKQHELRQDTRAQSITCRDDSSMETLGKIDRSKNPRRKTGICSSRLQGESEGAAKGDRKRSAANR